MELNYYDAMDCATDAHDVRLMGKRPSDSEKNRHYERTGRRAKRVDQTICRIRPGADVLATRQGILLSAETEQGIYFVNYDTDVHYKKIKFLNRRGLRWHSASSLCRN